MILGITGGTGCGKTTLLNVLQEHGCLVMDCDAIYHQLLETDQPMLMQLKERFPAAFENGVLNRKALGRLVFADPQALLDLNSITHSAVRRRVEQLLEAEPTLAAIDAIALFESGMDTLCNLTIAVTAPEEGRVQRLMKRDSISESYARSRIQAQHSPDWFAQRCDYILENTGTEAQFREKCLVFLRSEHILPECDILRSLHH